MHEIFKGYPQASLKATHSWLTTMSIRVGIISFRPFSLMESLKKKQGNKFPAKPLAKFILKD